MDAIRFIEFIAKISFRNLSNVMQLSENVHFLNEMFIQNITKDGSYSWCATYSLSL